MESFILELEFRRLPADPSHRQPTRFEVWNVFKLPVGVGAPRFDLVRRIGVPYAQIDQRKIVGRINDSWRELSIRGVS